MGVNGARFIYGVYFNNQLIFKGSRIEVCDKFMIAEHHFYEKVRQKDKYKNKFYIEKLGRHCEIEQKEKIKKEKKISQEQLDIEYMIRHFNHDNRVMTMFNPVPYFSKLQDLGYECKINGIYSNVDGKLVTSQHRKKDVHYIVERI